MPYQYIDFKKIKSVLIFLFDYNTNFKHGGEI